MHSPDSSVMVRAIASRRSATSAAVRDRIVLRSCLLSTGT